MKYTRAQILRMHKQGAARQKALSKLLLEMHDVLAEGKMTDERWLEYREKGLRIFRSDNPEAEV
jgi:hypothetical protein